MYKFTKDESDLIVSLILDNASKIQNINMIQNTEAHDALAAKVRNMTDY